MCACVRATFVSVRSCACASVCVGVFIYYLFFFFLRGGVLTYRIHNSWHKRLTAVHKTSRTLVVTLALLPDLSGI